MLCLDSFVPSDFSRISQQLSFLQNFGKTGLVETEHFLSVRKRQVVYPDFLQSLLLQI